MSITETKGFIDFKTVIIAISGFIAAFFCANIIIRILSAYLRFDLPRYWPLSVFYPRIPGWQDIVIAIVYFTFGLIAIKNYENIRKISVIFIIFFLLIMVSNLIQGIPKGFERPISGGGGKGQYYNDAIDMKNLGVLGILNQYNKIQKDLRVHSRTHPPGPIILFFILDLILKSQILISLAIAFIAALIIFLLSRILQGWEFADRKYFLWLFIFLPAVQIYALASVDAIISLFFFGAILYFRKSFSNDILIVFSFIFFFLASFFTFSFLFLIPLFFVYELYFYRTFIKSFFMATFLGAVYYVLFLFADFNFWQSFRLAVKIENPQGFHLLSEPWTYISTRLENVFEILLFLGPILCYILFLMIRDFKKLKILKSKNLFLSLISIVVLLIMFLTGVFRTGETARVCLFIFPFIMLLIADYTDRIKFSIIDKKLILVFLLIQTTLMQLFGNYFW